MTFELVAPKLKYLSSYKAALEQGWSPDNIRGTAAAAEELAAIAQDPDKFVASLTDLEAKGGLITLPDGSTARRLPGFRSWMWDGEFCGSIGFRWQPGTSELPPHCLGHIGYSVVPWKQRRGYATRALALLLPTLELLGLSHVYLTTDPDNEASQKVITANGGVLVERFKKPAAYGGQESLRFRIALPPSKLKVKPVRAKQANKESDQ